VEEPKPRVYVGIRWGMDNPTVMIAAKYVPPPRDHIHVFRELYESGFYFDDLLPVAKEWMIELNIRKFYCDPDEPEFIKRMRRQRLWSVPAPKELGLARNLLGKRIQNWRYCSQCGIPQEYDPQKNVCPVCQGKPSHSITVSPSCPKTAPEFGKYRMPDRDPRKPYRDKPLDMDNYGIGALHFLILGLATEVTPRVRWL
jgi:hypothetical protein